ncbi:MAG: phosphoglucosamine mutase [Lachnospiraceae bacterium]|nr:phosphoglucosamine mutase [Lachnospiraceae bacterium]
MARLFGTDGVRGVAGKELTVELAMQLGQAGACVLAKNSNRKPVILVGCDTRISGGMLANALIAGITSVGADVIYVGVAPTPAVAYLTRRYRADAGVVISASHNPVEFNGIKFFDAHGFKLPDATEDEIEAIIKNGLDVSASKTGLEVGRIDYRFDAADEYINHSVNAVDVDLIGMKIVADCAEGASFNTSIQALKRLGAEVIAIHDRPDGTNINKDCGSTHLGELCRRVVEEKADAGVAFDGDADRFLAVDEKGQVIDGDQIMAIVGLDMKERGKLSGDRLVVTVMSNLGLTIMADKNGINLEQTKVGDRYVLERMKEIGSNLGGEQSGHIIFLDENTTGDGLLSALHLLEVMKRSGKKLSELAGVMEVLPQALVNAKASNDKKHDFMQSEAVAGAIKALEEKYAGGGRVLIRPSGTEPLVRVMIEGRDKSVIDKDASDLAALIEKELG